MKLNALALVFGLAATAGAMSPDDRVVDREAIRAHIDSIFQAFIKKDAAELRATHEKNWIGYLEKLIPEETIAVDADSETWSNRRTIFEGSAEFARGGGKLVRLEFPKTEIRVYGSTSIVYSNYSYELETGGQRYQKAGRVTEVFVFRNGQWVNPGWHMDSGK